MPPESINIYFCHNFSFYKRVLSFFGGKKIKILHNKYYTSCYAKFGTKPVINKVNSSRIVSQRWQKNISQAPDGISSLTFFFRNDLSTKVQLFKSTGAFNLHFNLRELDTQNLWGSRIQDEKLYRKSRGFELSKARFFKKYWRNSEAERGA